jgi:integrase
MPGHIEPRANLDGSVSWRVIVPAGYGRGSRRVVRCVVTPRMLKNPPREAVSLLHSLQAQVDGGVIEDTHITVGDVLDRWLREWVADEERFSFNSRVAYDSAVRLYLRPALGHIRLKALRPAHVADLWRSIRAKGYELSSVRRYYAALHAALNWAKAAGLTAGNVCDSPIAKLPSSRPKERPVLSLMQMLAILDRVKGTALAAPILVACALGTRRGEAIGLKVGDIDIPNRSVQIVRSLGRVKGKGLVEKGTKGKSVRNVPVPTYAVPILNTLCEGRPEGAYVCGGVHPMTPESVSKGWRTLLDTLELPPLRFHDLRHSYATAMIEAGADIKSVQDALGHKQMSTTFDIYGHVTERMRERSVASLDAAALAAAELLRSTSVAKVLVERK